MTLWMFILIIFGGFIFFGAIVDYIAKKKNLQLEPEEGLKNASESERVYKELHLKQTIDDLIIPINKHRVDTMFICFIYLSSSKMFYC